MSSNQKTREERVLGRLIRDWPNWTPAPDLSRDGGLQLNARIYGIRHRLKIEIENKAEIVNGEKHSWYRLRRGMSDSLFGDLTPDRSYWE